MINSVLVFKILGIIIKNKTNAKLLSLVYLVSPINFVGLFSITGSYIIFGLFYTFLSFWLWLKFELTIKKRFYACSLVFFILAIFSAEISACLPLIILVIGKVKAKIKFLTPYFLLIGLNLLINNFWAGAPKNEAFQLKINLLPQAIRWYLLRAIGLPEGIKNGYWWEQVSLYLFLIIILICLFLGFIKEWHKIKENQLQIYKYLLWIMIGALPFYLLPNHLNPIYFSLSFLGFLLLMEKILNYNLIKYYTIIFILMSFIGIRLLSHTHWTVQRSTLAKNWTQKILAEQNSPIGNEIIIGVPSEALKQELQITMNDSISWRLFFKNRKLKVVYNVQ